MMKKNTYLAIVLGLSMLASSAVQARDTKHILPIKEAMQEHEKIDGTVSFYFAGQKTPRVLVKLGTDVSNRKTNSVGKSDEKACAWAFLSAMVSLQDRATALGANAVVNIESYYKKQPFASATEYECHAGAVIAGVALKGDFVTISK